MALAGRTLRLGHAVSLRYHSGDSRRLDTDRVTGSVTGLPNLALLSCGIFAARVVVHEKPAFSANSNLPSTPSTRMRLGTASTSLSRASIIAPWLNLYGPQNQLHASS